VEARKTITKKLRDMGIAAVMLGPKATPTGAIETYQDAKKCAKLFSDNRETIDGIIVILPNFGDEQAIVQSIDMAELNVPVLVQACDDVMRQMDLKHRRDSFCGKLSVCNNLYQYGIPFTNTQLHTCPIESGEFTADLERFGAICRVVKGLRTARIGAIGARPEAFHTVRFSEKLLQAYGIKVVTVDLSEIIAAAKSLDDKTSKVKKRLAEIRAYGVVPKGIPAANIMRQAKLSVAIEEWMNANECDASAIQCWSSIQQNYGCATCLTMSMMGERGRPSACEMDIAGTVSMYALQLASGEPSGFVDWNNNFDADREKCVVTHCSNYPKSFMGSKIEISNLDILGESLGAEHCFGAIKGTISPGPITYARISTDDTAGVIKGYVGEGLFTDDLVRTPGGIGVCEISDLQGLLNFLCQNGFEHHVAMNRSLVADVLEEALGKYLGWEIYHHVD
jgi:L-fucose isomerase-like protein